MKTVKNTCMFKFFILYGCLDHGEFYGKNSKSLVWFTWENAKRIKYDDSCLKNLCIFKCFILYIGERREINLGKH